MKDDVKDELEVRLRRTAVALVAIAAAAVGAVHASPPNPVVVAPLPDFAGWARQAGDATLIYETTDRGILLCNQGARLATFDVADPPQINDEGAVHLSASGPPKLVAPQGLTLPGPMTDAITITHPTLGTSPALDFGGIDPALTYELNRMFDIKRVRAQMTRTDTGKTFTLTEHGLYVISARP